MKTYLGQIVIIVTERTKDAEYHACIKGDQNTWSYGRSAEEATGRLIIAIQGSLNWCTIQMKVDQSQLKYHLDTAFRKALPEYSLRVKFDNHTKIAFKGHQILITDVDGFRVFHKALSSTEKNKLSELFKEYFFTAHQNGSDETSTVIIPTSQY